MVILFFFKLQHQFPKAQVEVYVLVLENDGSALAASLTCAGLALADASIPMHDLVLGASLVSYLESDELEASLYFTRPSLLLFL